MDFKSLEQTIFSAMCKVACEAVAEYLHRWDQIIMSRRDTSEYRSVDRRPSSIKTVMGLVHYERYYCKRKSGGYVFLLDEAMGVGKGYGLVSENLAEQTILECSDKSYRKAAQSISSLTGQTLSRMGAWQIVQAFGERVKMQEERLEELDSEGSFGQLGNIACPALFTEFDDVWLNIQREKRQKVGDPAAKARKRIGRRPMHIGTAYTGWVQKKDGSYETVDKFAYAAFSESKNFISRFEALLRHRFDMDGVELMLVNGDGEGWIKTVAENNDAVLQLDPFHRRQAIMRAVKDKDERKKLYDALSGKDVEKAIDVICSLIGKTSDVPSLKRLVALLIYFDGNKDNLLPWQERGLRIPAAPEGVVYRNMGVQEHNNCDLITQRMKHRKGSWSPAGANNMARALCLRNTIGLDAMLEPLPDPSAANTPTDPLSAAKTPLYDGKGYDASWLYAGMPFEQTFVTAGREAIRGLLRQRPLSSLAFK